jgi:hypothetical protein
MGRAYAQDVSPNCSRFCLKWEVDDNAPTGVLTCTDGGARAHPVWTNNWEELGNQGGGTVLACPSDGANSEAAAQELTNRSGREFVVYGSASDGFWIAFPDDVKLAELADEGRRSAAVKCGPGTDEFGNNELQLGDDPCIKDPDGVPYRRIFIEACSSNTNDISHFELIVDWCP